MGEDERQYAQVLLDELSKLAGGRGALLVSDDGRYMMSRGSEVTDPETVGAMALALQTAAEGVLSSERPVRLVAESGPERVLAEAIQPGLVLVAMADAGAPMDRQARALDEGAGALRVFLSAQADLGKTSSWGPTEGARVPEPRRILIVEDEPDIRDALKDLLQTGLSNVDVQTASSGQDALRLLPTMRPHVIVSDFKMPGMDGLQFLEASRALLPDAPKVLMTAYPDMEVAIKAINDAHIENFFQKPLDPAQVLAKVDRILQMQDAKAQRDRALTRSIDALKQRLAEVEGEKR